MGGEPTYRFGGGRSARPRRAIAPPRPRATSRCPGAVSGLVIGPILRAHEPHDGMADRFAHTAHLAVAAFVDHDADDPGRNGRHPAPGPSSPRHPERPLPQAAERPRARDAFHLGEVLLFHAEARVRQQLGESRRRWSARAVPRSGGRGARPRRPAAGEGTSSSTLRRPCGSSAVVTTPAGLFKQVVHQARQDAHGARSTATRSVSTSTRRPRTATSPFTVDAAFGDELLTGPSAAVTDPGEHLLEPLAFGYRSLSRLGAQHVLEHLHGRGRRDEGHERGQVIDRVQAESLQEHRASSRTRWPARGLRRARRPARSRARPASASRSRR